jgi:cyclopropane fatty-acyl-phospholipid synthase-like methyltransferase
MNCPICNEQSFYSWGKVGIYTIERCNGCGMGVTSPFPTGEDLAKANAEVYQLEKRVQTYLSRQEYFEKRYERHVSQIKLYKKSGQLLDIGCNIGLFLKVAAQNGFHATGVELNEECARYGRQFFDLTIFSEHLEKIGFQNDKFDIVTLFDVLEHIPDIKSFISEVRRILKPDGLLVVQSPNIGSLMAKLTKSKWAWLCPPDHLYHFTPDTMSCFLTAQGFTIQKMETWEPADDFSNNVLAAYRPKGIVGTVGSEFVKLTKIHSFFVSRVQHRWWRKMEGGLIEVYSVKSVGNLAR